jgi:hypothetical protein
MRGSTQSNCSPTWFQTHIIGTYYLYLAAYKDRRLSRPPTTLIIGPNTFDKTAAPTSSSADSYQCPRHTLQGSALLALPAYDTQLMRPARSNCVNFVKEEHEEHRKQRTAKSFAIAKSRHLTAFRLPFARRMESRTSSVCLLAYGLALWHLG